jgi:hypothetical protein
MDHCRMDFVDEIFHTTIPSLQRTYALLKTLSLRNLHPALLKAPKTPHPKPHPNPSRVDSLTDHPPTRHHPPDAVRQAHTDAILSECNLQALHFPQQPGLDFCPT